MSAADDIRAAHEELTSAVAAALKRFEMSTGLKLTDCRPVIATQQYGRDVETILVRVDIDTNAGSQLKGRPG